MNKTKAQKLNERNARLKKYETYKLWGNACVTLDVTIAISIAVKLISAMIEWLKWEALKIEYPSYYSTNAPELFLKEFRWLHFDTFLVVLGLLLFAVLLLLQQVFYTKAMEYHDG